jgi:general secretion pathway protein D
MMKFQKTISAVTATAFLLATVGLGSPALGQTGKAGTPDAGRQVRVAGPFGGTALAANTPAAPAGGTAGAGAAKAAGAAGGTSVDDLPLPGEKEFTECRAFPADKKVGITLKPETELLELVGWIKSISCRPFILPANIRQTKVTIIAPQLVTAGEAYRIFLSALEAMGLTVQPDGRVLKIIESNHARESSIPVINPGEAVPRTEQYVTRLLRLKYITTDEVVQVLSRLKGRDGDITPYSTTNTLVITDLASNIRRMEEVVRALDVAMTGEKIWVIRLRNIVATEVAQMLQQVFNVGKAATPGQPKRAPINVPLAGSSDGSAPPSLIGSGDDSISQIFPDDRTNSLIVVSSERTYQRVFALIKRLESQGGTSSGDRIHVYALENANADDIAGVLSGIVTVVGGGGSRSGAGGRGRPPSQPSSSGGQQAAGLFQDEVKVTPDKSTNSLVILAGSKDYLVVRDVIRRLDIPRRQVFIEAAVMEVNLSKARDLGLSYHGGAEIPGLGGIAVGGLKSGTLNSLSPLSLLSLPGLVGGVIGPSFTNSAIFGQASTAGATLPPQFGLIIQAMQTNNDVNIMQVPNILTTDNEKATITVGQNLPFPSAISGIPQLGASGLSNLTPLQSVQRQDVQLKLEITPHVNASDYVRLEIDNEISDVLAANYNNLGPATNKRTLKTVAVVRDQQPVVLGGIMKDSISESVTKIPILGDIPILGYLFKTRHKETVKQMLLIILTPYIINDPSDLQRIFERKTRERREFIEAYASFSDDRDVVGPIDYTRKRGALEEINRTAVEAEREMVELRAADQSLNREVIDAGPIELPPRLPSGPISAPPLPPPPSVGAPGRPAATPTPTPTPPPPGAPPQ